MVSDVSEDMSHEMPSLLPMGCRPHLLLLGIPLRGTPIVHYGWTLRKPESSIILDADSLFPGVRPTSHLDPNTRHFQLL